MTDDLTLRMQGPFHGRVDLWAERRRYFHQIHAGMIGGMLASIQPRLEQLGYLAARESSLQIAEISQSDLWIERESAAQARRASPHMGLWPRGGRGARARRG